MSVHTKWLYPTLTWHFPSSGRVRDLVVCNGYFEVLSPVELLTDPPTIIFFITSLLASNPIPVICSFSTSPTLQTQALLRPPVLAIANHEWRPIQLSGLSYWCWYRTVRGQPFWFLRQTGFGLLVARLEWRTLAQTAFVVEDGG